MERKKSPSSFPNFQFLKFFRFLTYEIAVKEVGNLAFTGSDDRIGLGGFAGTRVLEEEPATEVVGFQGLMAGASEATTEVVGLQDMTMGLGKEAAMEGVGLQGATTCIGEEAMARSVGDKSNDGGPWRRTDCDKG